MNRYMRTYRDCYDDHGIMSGNEEISFAIAILVSVAIIAGLYGLRLLQDYLISINFYG